MISSKQLEAFWERYQSEGVPNNLSMQAFCSMHNVPYNCFERHMRQRAKYRNIQPVTITDVPEEIQKVKKTEADNPIEPKTCRASEVRSMDDNKVRILVSIKMSNGFQIHRSNIDYGTLRGLVEKMEVLC